MKLVTGVFENLKEIFAKENLTAAERHYEDTRIGHLGYTNELTVLGALAGVEMGLELAGIPHQKGGVAAAMAYLAENARPATAKAA